MTRRGARRRCACPLRVIVGHQAVGVNDFPNAGLRHDCVEVDAEQPVAEHSTGFMSPDALHEQTLLESLLEIDLVVDGAIRPLRDAISRLLDGLVYYGPHTPRGILVRTFMMSRWAKPGQIIKIGGALICAAPTRGHLSLVYLLDHDLSVARKMQTCVIMCGETILHACVEAIDERKRKRESSVHQCTGVGSTDFVKNTTQTATRERHSMVQCRLTP